MIKPIAERIPPGYLTNLEDFTAALQKEATFRPFGELERRFTARSGTKPIPVIFISINYFYIDIKGSCSKVIMNENENKVCQALLEFYCSFQVLMVTALLKVHF